MLWQDLRYGLRVLARRPAFALVAVITLGLGIGANSAIFSIINGLLLRPLPYAGSDRLAIIWTHSPGANVEQDWPSPGQYSAIKSQNSVFETLAIAQGGSANLTGYTAPERIGAVWSSSEMFSLLGVSPIFGRVFTPDEDAAGTQKTAILSYGLWQRRFGGDPNILGQALTVDGDSYNVVGVMPAEFSLSQEVMPTVGSAAQAEILLSLPMSAKDLSSQGNENYNVLARLKPGTTIAQAQADLDSVVRTLEQQFPTQYPGSRRFRMSARPLLEQAVGVRCEA